MDFAVPHLWYGKVQARLTPTSDVQEGGRKKGDPSCLSELGRLATYIGHVPRVSICLC